MVASRMCLCLSERHRLHRWIRSGLPGLRQAVAVKTMDAFLMIPGNSRTAAGFWQLGAFLALVLLRSSAAASDFRFGRDTVGFANATVFEYREGHPSLRRQREKGEPKRYTRRCFVLCRTTMQFHKFARVDPHAPPVDDRAL